MIYFRKAKKVVAVPLQFVGDLRESAAKLKTVSIPTALAMTGLMLLFGDVGVAMADIPIGPGPTNYTEQAQPPPGTCHYRTAANGETLPDPNCTPRHDQPEGHPRHARYHDLQDRLHQVDPPAGFHHRSRKARQRSSIRLQRTLVGH